ncbi:MAG: prepilin-type N-terminal cleavage/methylation domain-containing protein [Elusimicrobiaceae bacterium]|nr:prepilin-type N-terminal cleavage/methylation domain-containing protein [Elusimicrobiaceae bacterium]
MIKIIQNCKKGFTLLELLVVILIIGILASIALPQYNKAVEKAKVTEALMNFKTIKESVDRYILGHNTFGGVIELGTFPLDVELSGGEFRENIYYTETYEYHLSGASDQYEISIYTTSNTNYYILNYNSDRKQKECHDGSTDMGKYICHYLESQGWEYNEGDY